jgi:hypothetical protein
VPERQLRARAVETMAPIGVRHVAVTAAYFELLGLGIREGHSFGAGHPSDVLINETLANRLFPGRDAIGQRIGFVSAQEEAPGEWFTVAGVVPFIRQRPSSEPEPILYQSLAAAPPATVSILVRHRLEPEAATALLRDVARRLDPRLPLYSVSTLRRGTLDAEWNGRISSRLLFALTAIAVLLGGVGLYAVTARAVASRRREIGIRVAIGAGTRQVARLVLTRAIVTVAAGLVVGTLGVVAWEAAFRPAARSRDVVPGAALADPFVLLSISAVLAIVTISACLAPIRRAQRVSPAVALRCE